MATTRLYEVFARRTREEPLGHIGTIRAADEEFARVYARSTYDEENWAEMTIVPREAVVHVRELEPLIDVGDGADSDVGDWTGPDVGDEAAAAVAEPVEAEDERTASDSRSGRTGEGEGGR